MKLPRMPAMSSLQRNRWRMNIYTHPKFGIIARKWPEGSQQPRSEAEATARNDFAVACMLMKYAAPEQWVEARRLAHGRALYPRDVMMSAIYGKLYPVYIEAIMPSGAGLTYIGQVRAAASAIYLTIDNIPQLYTDLIVTGSFRSTKSAASDTLFMRFNNDTGSNYNRGYHYSNGSSAGQGEQHNQTAFTPTDILAATGLANQFTPLDLAVMAYRETDRFKTGTCLSYNPFSETAALTYTARSGFTWKQTPAITRIDFYCSGFAPFVDGSTFTLYGRG